MASSSWPHDANHVFSSAIASFRNSLGSKEKSIFKEFDSSKEMLTDLQTRCKDVRNGRKLSSLCRKIDRFASRWEPFFEITNIFVQTHPEFAGLAWGAIRLVFLLGTNYTTYLEKIVTMIQNIGETLPAYEEYLQMFVARRKKFESETGSTPPNETRHHRLLKALSYVYADIVQFCQEACNIFSTKRGGVSYKPSLISDLFWKPFDARFSALLDRLRSHQELFKCEMQLEESKHLEHQNEHRAYQSELDGRVLRQIQKQVKDLRSSNDALESRILTELAAFESKMRTTVSECNRKESERREADVMNSKVSDIKNWVNAPGYKQEFEKAQKTRLPYTGEYIFSDAVYQSWNSGKSMQHEASSAVIAPQMPQILLVKGKPGYGKTVLSSILIEDLKNNSPCDGAVLFYHFSTERREHCSPYYALRAVLVQLLHKFRLNKDVLDRTSVLMESDNSGQLTASDQEILAALSLLLEDLEKVVLVFDGLDECEDATSFLEIIRDLCGSTPTKVLLLSRPNVELPVRFQHLSICLSQTSNLEDIKTYLEPQILLLKDRRLLSDETSLDTIVETLASRAEGMFLWAWLMTQYLNCRLLSPKERHAAIFEAVLVERLENMYDKILRVLDRGYAKEKASVLKIFELVAISFRPILATELKVALAITPGTVTDSSSFIVEFEESLPIVCGAVVELQSDGSVRFIHSSFREFLVSSPDCAYRKSFTVDERTAHVRFATICLSYLIYDLPSSPLSGTTGKSSPECLKASFPFIEIAQQWVKHVVSGFKDGNDSISEVEAGIQDEFYSILAQFINRPLTVTVWIEASRTFGLDPSLRALIALHSEQISPEIAASPFRTGNLTVTLLEELATELEHLNSDWGHLLKQDPSAIWKSSITAFSRSSYWFETKDTRVSSLLPSEAAGSYRNDSSGRSVLVLSQLSSSGNELGIILVLPSRSYLAAAESVFGLSKPQSQRKAPVLLEEDKQRLMKICSSGWKVQYQRRTVIDEKISMDFEVDLPEHQVFEMLQQCLSSKTPHRFPFPVAFSHDLDRLVVLRFLLIIRMRRDMNTGQRVPQYRCQLLEKKDAARLTANGSDKTAFYSVFSPNAKALAIVFGSRKPGAIDRRQLQVWSEADDTLGTMYQCKGEVTTTRLSCKEEALRDQFAFHPLLPLLVYTEWNTTVAWMFNHVGPAQKITIIKKPVSSLRFSPSGFSLYYSQIEPGGAGLDDPVSPPGISSMEEDLYDSTASTHHNSITSATFSTREVLDTHVPDAPTYRMFVSTTELDFLRNASSEITKLFSQYYTLAKLGARQLLNPYTHLALNEALDQTRPTQSIQTTNSASALVNAQTTTRKITPGGAVTIGSSLVAHLPRLQQGGETHISLLPSREHDEWVRMVWNKGPQETYSIHDHQSPHLPSIIYRRQGTIETTTDNPRGVKRPRLR